LRTCKSSLAFILRGFLAESDSDDVTTAPNSDSSRRALTAVAHSGRSLNLILHYGRWFAKRQRRKTEGVAVTGSGHHTKDLPNESDIILKFRFMTPDASRVVNSSQTLLEIVG